MDGSLDIVRALQVLLGIGLVIFVHELGHYLAARACGVRVETFSLGFGPRLLGAYVGPTLYQIALIPLGGFCRMAGEERRQDGLPPEPDELPAKSVGQRFFIYSGGVLMNVLFGLIVFPILFQIGVPFTRPTIGEAIPGGAAWHARLPENQEVVSVNGNQVFEFNHIYTEVALGDPLKTEIVLRDPVSGQERSYELAPKRDDQEGIVTIGVAPDAERDAHGHMVLHVREDSPAQRAGVHDGDRLVEVLDGPPGLSPIEQLELLRFSGRPWHLRIESDSGQSEVSILPETTASSERPRVGIAAPVNRLFDLRESASIAAIGLEPGDLFVSVNDIPILERGDLQRALLSTEEPAQFRVRRGGEELVLTGPRLTQDEALALIADLALSSDGETTRIVVQPDEAAARAGLRTLDEVLSIDGTEVHSWTEIRALVERASAEERSASFRVQRPGEREHLTIAVRPEARAEIEYGLVPRQAEYVYRSENLGAAIVFGARFSWRFLEDSWLTLKRMLTRDVSPKNVGGIITITRVSYSLTEAGWTKFFFFLCLVSINLAFLNVLPIPVLDGGHLFFLVIEKLKGSPVSGRVLGTSQAVGVVLLLSLMVYVTYNDIVRWFTE